MYKIAGFCLITCAIIGSLLNLPLFGGPTLTAYFFFSIVAATAGAWLITQRPFIKLRKAPDVPVHFLVFFFFVSYVLIHGAVLSDTNLVHYYWLTALTFVFTLHIYKRIDRRTVVALQKVIVWAALVECLVVFLQALKVTPSADPLFPCTGTWINPNVTALFLAMAFYTVLKPDLPQQRIITVIATAAIFVSILLLQCRAGLLMLLLFAAARFGRNLPAIGRKPLNIGKKTLVATGIIAGVCCLALLSFGMKQASTTGRWLIWKNCLPLIAEKPFFGHGFGSFEKVYNLYVATKPLPSVDHVNMAYDDFMQLAVEGGACAVILWGAFLVTTVKYCIRNRRPLAPILAFAFLQIVNFGFQAIPAFVLFLVYIATDTGEEEEPASFKPRVRRLGPVPSLFYYALPVMALFLAWHQLNVAKAFYLKMRIAANYSARDAVEAYADLDEQLDRYQRYQEDYGDAWLRLGRHRAALTHYLAAAEVCSEPGILTKCGWCYELAGQYDSSRYYFMLVQNIQPELVGPRMHLLDLYRRRGDSAAMLLKASEIVAMPDRVRNPRADTMRLFAKRILEAKRLK